MRAIGSRQWATTQLGLFAEKVNILSQFNDVFGA
jgi:hypothetical protein